MTLRAKLRLSAEDNEKPSDESEEVQELETVEN